VHIPWCVRKCPYCDFNSHEAGNTLEEDAYIEALLQDLDQERALTGKRDLNSIFFGGGTPSLLSATAIDNILNGIASRYSLTDDIEITLEANPGTFEQHKFNDYHTAGINRLSIGIQSFENSKLKALGRIHDSNEALCAIDTARDAGFDNLNLDLMFGLPGQSTKQAITDLQTACNLEPEHLSHYQLTIEPNTYFHKHPPQLPGDDNRWHMQQACHQLLSTHGYSQYEVSAFSKPGKESRHNLNYWQFGDYIGIGAGAHGKLTDLENGQISRRWKHRQPLAYMRHTADGNASSGTSTLDQSDILFEFLMNALRLKQGFDFDLFEQRTGLSKTHLINACSKIDPELIHISDRELKTSPRGYDFLNEVLEKLVP
jgi:oxygen-independent coproporphyrinogen-3 oxidase